MEAHQHVCLNCDAALISTYCHQCGQKAATHRVTLPHLIRHDLVHGIWHVDKGLLFTLREAFLRPGHMSMNYIRGKRIRYYNVFYLILLVLGINVLVVHFFKAHYHIAEGGGAEGIVLQKDTVDVSYYVSHYFKFLLFLIIPVFALCGYVSFRRLRLNFAEHAIIASTLLLTGAMWYLFVIVGVYSSISVDSEAFDLFIWILAVLAYLQPARVYFQAARKVYTPGGVTLRILLWYVCLIVLLFLVLMVIMALTGKTSITLS